MPIITSLTQFDGRKGSFLVYRFTKFLKQQITIEYNKPHEQRTIKNEQQICDISVTRNTPKKEGRKNEQTSNPHCHKNNSIQWKREGRKNEQTVNAHRHNPNLALFCTETEYD